MLDNEVEKIVSRVKKAATVIWGDKFEIKNINVFHTPFCSFEILLFINHKHSVDILYDRSIIDIAVIGEEKKWLTDLTDKEVIEGFESSGENNLIANFKVLDEVLNKL